MTVRREDGGTRHDGTARGWRIVVPLGGGETSLTEAEATKLRDELSTALGSGARSTATYNPDEVERLVREAREDDARMTPGPWLASVDTVRLRDGSMLADMMLRNRRPEDAPAIARQRNNLAAMADQLEAARREIDSLTAAARLSRSGAAEAMHDHDRLVNDLEAARARIAELEALDATARGVIATHAMAQEFDQRRIGELEGAVARMAPVVAAAKHWREMRYPQKRCWKADCTEDMNLVSAVDTYLAK